LVGQLKASAFYKDPTQKLICETFEIELRNRNEEAVRVQMLELGYGCSNWEIQQFSHAIEQKDAQPIEFAVEVAAGGSQLVSCRVPLVSLPQCLSSNSIAAL